MKIAFILGSLFFLSSQDAQATHIVGGDLTYECLGSNSPGKNTYRFRLTIRRDCQFGADDAPFDNPAAIGMYDLLTGAPVTGMVGFPFNEIRIAYNSSDTLNEVIMSDCGVRTGDVCVETFVYDTIVELEIRPTGYIFVYQRCCRNGSLTNLVDPLATGMTLVAELTGPAQMECNSSPLFGDFPPVYTCVNSPIMFNHSAIDVDGDSLVYELCTPLTGGSFADPKPNSPNSGPPYETVVFRPPYSLSNVMGGVPLQIDPNTGLITGTPNIVGQFVVGICVTAYKNGVMTGKTRRDFQYNVRTCRDVPIPAFSAPALDCEDLTVVFDNQTLLADQVIWIFDMNDPNSPTSTEFEPTFTYPQGGFYDVGLVTFVMEGDSIFCRDTLVHTIGVFDSQVTAGFTHDVSSCSDNVVLDLTDASFDPDPNYDICSWSWSVFYDQNILISTDTNPSFTLLVDDVTSVLVILEVTSCNGCTDTITRSFPVQTINIQFDPDADHLCRGDSTHLLLNGDTFLIYTWNPTIGMDLTEPFDPVVSPDSTTTYCVTVTDGLCEVSDCVTVEVQQLPDLAFTYETDCKNLVAVFDNNSTGGVNFHWDFGTGNPEDTLLTTAGENPSFTFPGPGEYMVTLSSRDGCDVSITQTVTVDAITVTFPDRLVNCFQDSIELNPNPDEDFIYVWSPAELLDDPNSANPTAGITNDTKFFVTVSSPGLPGCEIVDSILVLVPDSFTVNAGADVTTCVLDSITLTATATTTPPAPPGNFDFVWTDVNGDTLSLNDVLVVFPAETDTFYVTATDSLGCSETDFVIVNRPDPTFEVVACFTDSVYCDIQSITLCATSNPGVTLEWFNDDGVLQGEGDSIIATPGPANMTHCFVVIGTDMLGCQESDTVCLTPTSFEISITEAQSICLDEVVQISVTDALGQDLSYLWTTNETTQTISVSPPMTTTYCVTVTNNDVGCTMELCSEVVVNLFEPLDVIITSDPPEIILTQSAVLSTNQPDNFDFIWESSNPTESVDDIPHPTVTPTVIPTTYSVTVTNDGGCTATASYTIPIVDPPCTEEDIFLPNAFTPNGDNHNDILYVRSNFVSTLDLYIYNRWGQQVFHTNNINVGWDGTFNGERLPPDVYGYFMNISCPNGKNYNEKGNITLLE